MVCNSDVTGGRIYRKRDGAGQVRAEVGEDGEGEEDEDGNEWKEVEAVDNGESRLRGEDNNTKRQAALCLLSWKSELQEEDVEHFVARSFRRDVLDWQTIHKR